jgi:hypothetical protein
MRLYSAFNHCFGEKGRRRISMSAEKQTIDGGRGPRFEVEDFPEPLRDLTPKKLFAILGPAVIALGGTIGGGEWLIGPSLFVKWGLALLWVTTVSSILQVFLNLEMCRYTLWVRTREEGWPDQAGERMEEFSIDPFPPLLINLRAVLIRA